MAGWTVDEFFAPEEGSNAPSVKGMSPEEFFAPEPPPAAAPAPAPIKAAPSPSTEDASGPVAPFMGELPAPGDFTQPPTAPTAPTSPPAAVAPPIAGDVPLPRARPVEFGPPMPPREEEGPPASAAPPLPPMSFNEVMRRKMAGEPTPPEWDQPLTPNGEPIAAQALRGIAKTGEFGKGLSGAIYGGNAQMLGNATEALGILAGSEKIEKLGGDLAKHGKEQGDQYKPRVPGFENVRRDSFGNFISDAFAFAGYSAGQAVGTSAPSIAAGSAAAVLTANPFIGIAMGAIGPSYIQNWGDVYGSAKENKGIAARIEKGELSKKDLAGLTAIAAVPIAALDVVGLETMLGHGAFVVAKQGLKNRVMAWMANRAIAAGTEGTTEGLQEVLSQWAQHDVGGDQTLKQAAFSVINNALGGVFGGGLTSAAASVGEQNRNAPGAKVGEALDQMVEGAKFKTPTATAAAQAFSPNPEAAGTPGDFPNQPLTDRPTGPSPAVKAAAEKMVGDTFPNLSPQEVRKQVDAAAVPPDEPATSESDVAAEKPAEPAEPAPPPASPRDAAILKSYGYDDADIAEMPPEQRAEEIKAALDAGIGEPEGMSRDAPIDLNGPDALKRADELVDEDHTHAQAEGRNRPLVHATWGGLPLSIEARAGGTRKMQVPETGEPVTQRVGATYGYWKGTKGGDGQEVDVAVGPHLSGNYTVYVIDENGKNGKFRQVKTFIGFANPNDAVSAYLGSGKSADSIGSMVAVSSENFRKWIKKGGRGRGERLPKAWGNKVLNLQDLDQYKIAMSQSENPVVSQLRGEGDSAGSGVGVGLSGVQGAFGDAGSSTEGMGTGSDRQREGVLPRQPSLGEQGGPSSQYEKSGTSNAGRQDNGRAGVGSGNRSAPIDDNAPSEKRGEPERGPVFEQKGRSSDGVTKPAAGFAGAPVGEQAAPQQAGEGLAPPSPANTPKTADEAQKALWEAKYEAQKVKRDLDRIESAIESPRKGKNSLDQLRLDELRKRQEGIARSLRKKYAEALDAVDDAREAVKRAHASAPAKKPEKPDLANRPSEPTKSGATAAPSPEELDIPTFLKRNKANVETLDEPTIAAAQDIAVADPAEAIEQAYVNELKSSGLVTEDEIKEHLGDAVVESAGTHEPSAPSEEPRSEPAEAGGEQGNQAGEHGGPVGENKPSGEESVGGRDRAEGKPEAGENATGGEGRPVAGKKQAKAELRARVVAWVGDGKSVIDIRETLKSEGVSKSDLARASNMAEHYVKQKEAVSFKKPVGQLRPDKRAAKPNAGPNKQPAPAKPHKQWKPIGKNRYGSELYEDERGVRSVLNGDIRYTEPVALRPTREGMKVEVRDRSDEYLTEGEYAAANPPAEAPTEPKPSAQQESGDDLDALFDKALDESFVEKPVKAAAKPLPAPERVQRAAKRRPAAAAASAARETTKGLDEAATALFKLFGGNKVSEGFTFDEDTYRQAIPHFKAATAHFFRAGKDIAEAMRGLIEHMRDKLGMTKEAIASMKPYVVKFVRDVRDGAIVLEEPSDARSEQAGPGEVGDGGERPPEKERVASGGAEGKASPGSVEDAAPKDGDTTTTSSPDSIGARPGGPLEDGDKGVSEGGNAADGRRGTSGERVASDGTGGRTGGRTAGVRPNYHIADPEALIGGTPKVRFARNRAAIEAYRAITEEGRAPTAAELDALAAYTGWGSFGQPLFQGTWERPRPAQGWEKEDAWLREHLGEDEWRSAQASIINAHYTDPPTVKAMWDIVRRLGFKGGRVLEPSMGVGNFFGLMPRDMMAQSQLTGIELDKLTGGMAMLLYPDANIQIKPYQDSKTADGFYDLVIGNWPFAAQAPADRRYAKLNATLHDFFFVKALDQTRPGGIVIGITSAGTMDKVGKSVRLDLAKKAKLLGAYRLPTGAFEKYAGTAVVADIIVLQKRTSAPTVEELAKEPQWLEAIEIGEPGRQFRVNQYWAENRSNVLGELAWGTHTTTGRPGMTVERPADIEQRLADLPNRFEEGAYKPIERGNERRFVSNNSKDRQGSVTIGDDGGLYQVEGDRLVSLESHPDFTVKNKKLATERVDQVRRMVGLRRDYGRLIDSEREGRPDAETIRAALKSGYDKFRAKYGPIIDSDGLSILQSLGDPSRHMVAALEGPGGKPAGILTQPTLRGKRKIDRPSISDAFVIARNESTTVDIERIAKIAQRDPQSVANELLGSHAIYRLPGGGYETADVYLSGNVRRKLNEAEDALVRGEPVQGSIDALHKVIPPDVPYFQIEAKLGATWVSNSDYEQFVKDLLGVESSDAVHVNFSTGSWKVEFDERSGLNSRPEATTTWGVEGYKFSKLLQRAFNNQTITIKTKDKEGNIVVDEQASKEASDKAQRVREEFTAWAWRDAERRVRLEGDYNQVMNAIAIPSFDGSFLEFPGMALRRGEDQFSLRKHQVDAIWRGIANRRGLYAHEVGTGKTYTMGGIAVESRRYGIARKPLIIAHNANSASVASEINDMYPGAQVLYVDNLTPDTIQSTLYRIANEDWDAVVIPHSLIDRMALTEETLMEIAKEDIAALEDEAIVAAQEDGARLSVEDMGSEDAMKKVRSPTAKDLVKQRNKIIETIKSMGQRASREGAISFEGLGIDMILVDEVHEFKKPPITTRMRMKGLNTGTSNRSIALRFLTDYVKRMNGGNGVHLFTGTPITNTLTEAYSMQRYVMDDEMALNGIRDWDPWFNTFAGSTNDIELTPTGEYEPVSRLAAFVNVPELRRMFGQYMDIVFADDMPEFKPRTTADGKTMASKDLSEADRDFLTNGRSDNPIGRPYKKIIPDVAPMGAAQESIMRTLIERAKSFKNASKKDRRALLLSGDPSVPIRVESDAAKAGMDVRLFDKDAPDEPSSKANRAVRNILKHYKEHPLSTQVLFMEQGGSDTSTRVTTDPKTGDKIRYKVARFNLVKDIIDKLVKGGVKPGEIRVVDGKINKAKRKEIADLMNEGKVRVVIGNTKTLGVGVNMQRNLRAMHHLDAPWMPGDLEQRNGRGQRQGNHWNTVLEYRYITERLDGRRWQVLSVKDRFIKSFLKSDEKTRIIEGDATSDQEGDSANDLIETLSEAAGDPRILMSNKYKMDIARLEGRERLHTFGVSDARKKARSLTEDVTYLRAQISKVEPDAAHAETLKGGPFKATVGGKEYSERKDAQEAIDEQVSTLESGDTKTIGNVQGFDITASWRAGASIEWVTYTLSSATAKYNMAKPSVASAEATIRNIPKFLSDLRQEIADKKQSIDRMKAAAEMPFAQSKQLAQKRQLLADLEIDLQNNPTPPPSWLRHGAPTGSAVFVNGEERTVEGHKWTDDGYFVLTEGGPVPYLDARDASGTRLYEAHPFAPPPKLSKEEKKDGEKSPDEAASIGGYDINQAERNIELNRLYSQERILMGRYAERPSEALVREFEALSERIAELEGKSRDAVYSQQAIKAAGKWTEARKAQIAADVAGIVRRVVGDNVRLNTPETHRISNLKGWGDSSGSAEVAGAMRLSEALLTVSISPKFANANQTAYHEAYHAIEGLLQTDQERALMERETPQLRQYLRDFAKTGALAGITANEVDQLAGYEVRAIMFELYGDSTDKFSGGSAIRRFFLKVHHIAQRFMRVLRMRGFRGWEDVFEAAYHGEFARREARPLSERTLGSDTPGAAARRRGMTPARARSAPGLQVPHERINEALHDPTLTATQRLQQAMGAATLPVSRAMWDRTIDLYRFQRAAEIANGWAKTPAGLDSHLAATLYTGRTGARFKEFKRLKIDPILNAMNERGITLDDMNAFLYARHAEERNKAIEAIDPTNTEGSGMSTADANAILAKFGAQRADFDAVAAMVDDVLRESRRMLVNSGLESQSTIQEWEAKYAHYVPLKGSEMADDEWGSPGVGEGYSIRGPESMRALGRHSRAGDIMANVFDQSMRAIVRAEKNRVALAFYRFAKANPSPWYKMGLAERRRHINPNTGLVEWQTVTTDRNAESAFAVKIGGNVKYMQIMHPGLLIALKDVGGERMNAFFRGTAKFTRFYSSLQTAKNPEFVLTNLLRDLADAGLNLTAEQQSGFKRAFAKNILSGKALLAAVLGETRDASGTGSVAKAIEAKAPGFIRYYDEWQAHGGKISMYGLKDIQSLADELRRDMRRSNESIGKRALLAPVRAPGGLIKLFEGISDITESMTRLAVYAAAREAGLAPPVAAKAAREMTVDFNAKGQYGRYINALYAFAGPSIIGPTRLVRRLARSKTMRRAAMGVAGLGLLATLWNLWAAPKDDEDKKNRYARMKYWEREKNFVVFIPGWKDGLKIPMGYGVAPFWMIGEEAAMALMGETPWLEAAGNVIGTLASTFNPLGAEGSAFSLRFWASMATPTILDPVMQLLRNRNWLDRPIHPDRDRFPQGSGLANSEIAKATTSPYAVGVAKWLNRNSGGGVFSAIDSKYQGTPFAARPGALDFYPDDLEFAWNFALGGLGKFVLQNFDMFKDIKDGVDTPVERTPFIRRFAVPGESEGLRASEYYDSAHKVSEAAASYRASLKSQDPSAKGLRDELKKGLKPYTGERGGQKFMAEDVFANSNETLKRLRKNEEAVKKDEKLTPEGMAAAIQDIRKRRLDVMRRTNRLYESRYGD